MKNKTFKILTMFVLLGSYVQVVHAEETVGEKVEATANDAKRGIKKVAHRAEEAMCAKGDMKCTGKKVKNRAVESKDATVDGAKELGNKID